MRVTNRSAFALATLATILAMTAMSAMQSASAADKAFDKTFPATPGGTLTVDADFGTILVKGGDVREVTVHVTMSGAEGQLRDFDLNATTDARGVSVRGRRRSDWWLDLSWVFGGGMRAKFEIQVPREYHLDLKTSGGAIEAQNLKGNVYGHTSGGHLMLNSIVGDIDVRTSGGRIQADRVSGNTQLRTSGGGISVNEASGELELHTSGGGIRLQNIEAKLSAKTSGGGIDAGFRGPNRGVTLRTSGGGIRIAIPKDFKATVDAHTSGGSVQCELPYTSRGEDARRDSDYDEKSRRNRAENEKRDRNELYADINGGGAALSARTSGGSIRIREALGGRP